MLFLIIDIKQSIWQKHTIMWYLTSDILQFPLVGNLGQGMTPLEGVSQGHPGVEEVLLSHDDQGQGHQEGGHHLQDEGQLHQGGDHPDVAPFLHDEGQGHQEGRDLGQGDESRHLPGDLQGEGHHHQGDGQLHPGGLPDGDHILPGEGLDRQGDGPHHQGEDPPPLGDDPNRLGDHLDEGLLPLAGAHLDVDLGQGQ